MATIRFRRGPSARWFSVNPLLDEGEPGFETDTGRIKIGDGRKLWNTLPYLQPGSTSEALLALTEHISSELPHPVYDDGPSLDLLYQNAKV